MRKITWFNVALVNLYAVLEDRHLYGTKLIKYLLAFALSLLSCLLRFQQLNDKYFASSELPILFCDVAIQNDDAAGLTPHIYP